MKVQDIIFEANVMPDAQFMNELGSSVDEALDEYAEYLADNNDVDDIDELAELLNASVDEELRVDFVVNHAPMRSDWWINAENRAGETADGERVNDIIVYLNAKNMEGVYGPKTFKKLLMRLMSHELVHAGQYARIPSLDDLTSGYEKAAAAKTPREWERKYLRDPHELMAYGETLANEIQDAGDPDTVLRNPDRYMDQLPTYARFRNVFNKDSPQIKTLLKYTFRYIRA